MRKNGFTFIELMIAVVIGAFVTVTAVAAMRGIASGKVKHERLTELSDEVRYAERQIRQDLYNLYRNADFKEAQFELSYLETEDELPTQSLMFYTISRNKVRQQQPESDVYEVQYAMERNVDTEKMLLTRRCCPVVPGVTKDDKDRGWGVIAPMTENIAMMSVRCYDGEEWIDVWGEKNGAYPGLVEVSLLVVGESEKLSFQRSFLIHLPRLITGGSDSETQDQEQGPQQDNSQQNNNTENQSTNGQNEGERS